MARIMKTENNVVSYSSNMMTSCHHIKTRFLEYMR